MQSALKCTTQPNPGMRSSPQSFLLRLVCACTITLSAATPGHASFVLSGGATQNLPVAGNDFNADLTGLGFDTIASGAQLRVSQNGFVDFSYVGAESGYTNTFTSGSNAATEHNEAFNFAGYSGFTISVSAGDIVNFNFTSGNANALSPVDNLNGSNLQGLGIYFDNSESGSLLQLVLGYDDQIFNDDDDFDDMLVRADFRPVPLPAAVYLFGTGLLALIGVARKRRG